RRTMRIAATPSSSRRRRRNAGSRGRRSSARRTGRPAMRQWPRRDHRHSRKPTQLQRSAPERQLTWMWRRSGGCGPKYWGESSRCGG
ncbi:MAG: hypothetical protein KBG77_10015, partial [Dermatophilaceae bacterium]|nr:hypothetical protein [Dermatophilaceae bacterium]